MKTALLKGHVLGLLLVVSLAGGCGRVVNITATEDICRKSVEVHLVGVNRFEKDRWETMSMSDYWTPENQLRKSAREYTHVIQFGQGPCQKTLTAKDAVHKIWKSRKAEYVFVLADLPGIFPDLPGNADARRLRLPAVDSECWGVRQKTINISIERGNIVPLTIPKSNCD
ncbi:MAG TPA: hypothetical protein VMW16_10030 [Sedimentisphaerales bacterium]|nr:hypothetical protein [Sedimentisphaerales bacterium]